eukprot:gene10726-19439_t
MARENPDLIQRYRETRRGTGSLLGDMKQLQMMSFLNEENVDT